MNKKNLKYKKYFLRLNLTLKKLNNKFLFYIPDLYKKDLRKDKISIIKIKFSFFKSLFSKNYLYGDIEKIKKCRICFISHYVGDNNKDKDLDFYYGKLLKNLKIKNPFYVLLINHTNESLVEIKKKFKNSKITRAYINHNFNFMSDLPIILKITKEFWCFKINNIFNPKKFKLLNRINQNFTYKYFLKSRYTYKISNSITKILDKSKNLNNLIITFEGHAFEKIIFNYCKKKNIRSFGYFFSVIREYKNSIYYKFDKNYQPDVVLTSGNISKEDLKLNSPHKNIKILGCNKDTSKNVQFNILKNKDKKITTVLVCPEGLFSETKQMLKLINNDLLNHDNIKFIFRTHPLIDVFRDFRENKVNKNIIFSKDKDIKKDFKKSDVILYSGSSVCVQAVMNGLVPINFNNEENNFSLDPLYKINKFIIKDSKMLEATIISINENRFRKRFKKNIYTIKKYCNLYFKEFNQGALIKSIITKK